MTSRALLIPYKPNPHNKHVHFTYKTFAFSPGAAPPHGRAGQARQRDDAVRADQRSLRHVGGRRRFGDRRVPPRANQRSHK